MMDKIRIKILEPDEFYLVDHFFDDEGVPRLDPNFSKVIAALDIETGKAVGVMCLQMVLHAEPIIIEPAYRGMGLWEPMAKMADGYLQASGVVGLYAQPLHESTKHMCRQMGFEEMPHSLFSKAYVDLKKLFPNGSE